jgi:hypothetical protein
MLKNLFAVSAIMLLSATSWMAQKRKSRLLRDDKGTG